MSSTGNKDSTQRGLTESTFAKPGAPSIAGPEGIRYDFNYGCRVQVPVDGWRVRMVDLDTHSLLFDEPVEAGVVVTSRRKYFVRFLLRCSTASASCSRTLRRRGKESRACARRRWRSAIRSRGCRSSMRSASSIECELIMLLRARILQPLFRAGYPAYAFRDEENSTARRPILCNLLPRPASRPTPTATISRPTRA